MIAGNKGGGGISTVLVDGTSITGNGVSTALAATDQGGQTAQEVTDAIAAALASAGLGANAGKLLRVDDGITWEAARPSRAAFTAIANGPSTKCTVTSAAHGQREGATVTIVCSTPDAAYDGARVISNVTENTFDIIATFGVTRTGYFTASNEYFSADRRGGQFGTIYRQRYTGFTGAASVVVEAGYHTTKRFVGQGGKVTDTATGSTLTLPTYFGAVSAAGVNDNGTDLVLIVGTGFDDANDVYDLWVDSSKV